MSDDLKRIKQCMTIDQFSLRKSLNSLQKNQSQSNKGPSLEAIRKRCTASIAKRKQRNESIISPEYPEELPIIQVKTEIEDAITANQVVIICGETGSGKTTQIPKICLALGRGVAGNIGHTQPRRLAARSVAVRIAEELKTELGSLVGYKVRFTDQVSASTRVKLMTDGILLAEIQKDPYLNQYDTLIVDEAHERSLNIDFLLGYIKQLLPKRRDLKVIITSATIDPMRFSKHFSDAPVILAEGRTYPVELKYQPIDEESEEDESRESVALLNACEELMSCGAGDILVFLPGEREIREHDQYLKKKLPFSKRMKGTEVLPLFARLTIAEQTKIFAKHQQRRIILATNVAETSLTVPGIRYVVDFGLARVSRYSVRSKVQRLPVEKVSQASANQRKGRCGREAPGICIRLYSSEDFDARPEFTEPEIQRTNLASVILQMSAMRLGNVENFPFIEPPAHKYINDGYRLLQEIRAVSDKRQINTHGRKLARLPVDPRLAAMMLASNDEGCIEEVLTIVSALSVQDPRERPYHKQQAADELHREFNDERSDFMSWLNLWVFLETQSTHLSNNQFRKMCKQRYLSYMRVREWRDVRRQLVLVLKEMRFKLNNTEASYENIHRALLTGLLSNVCKKTDQKEYLGTRNRRVSIFPGSGLFKTKSKWIMSAQISETSKLYARSVAVIQPEWVESLSGHLLNYSYFGQSWQAKRGQVGAFRKSTLYGLEVNPKARVNFGPIDPVQSREIFIRQGLVEGQYKTKSSFYHHNLAMIDEVKTLEDKSRRRDILVDPEQLFQFYDHLVPEGVYSRPQFEKWREEYEKTYPKGLFFSLEFLVSSEEAAAVSTIEFPDQMEFSGVVLPLSYKFEPGVIDDGVTLSVPASMINRVSPKLCEWLVPGLLEEKLTLLLKSLPKALRKNFVPVPNYVKECLGKMEASDKSLLEEYSYQLRRINNVEILKEQWNESGLPDYLRMNYRLLDEKGHILDEGRDIELLQKKYSGHVEQELSQSKDHSFEKENITQWNFGDLPHYVEIETGGIKLKGYPALKVEKAGIALRLFASEEKAVSEMHFGLRALFANALKTEIKYMRRQLPGINQLCLRFTPFGSCDELKDDIIAASIDGTFINERAYPVNHEQYMETLEDKRSELVGEGTSLCHILADIFSAYRDVSKRLEGSVSLSWIEPAQDIHDQMTSLVYKGFVSATPKHWLMRVPAYLSAIGKRLDALDQAPDKDRRLRSEFLPLWEKYKAMPTHKEHVPHYEEKMIEIRWLIEELKISLFAQSIGTREKVSIKRLETKLAALK